MNSIENMSEDTTVNKSEIIKEFGANEQDTGSCEVQIALLTARVKHLTEHLRENRKDFHSRRGLIAMTARRRKLLDYLKRNDFNRYTAILDGLRLFLFATAFISSCPNGSPDRSDPCTAKPRNRK
jgi:small subunit ribosomal protein S15